MSSHKPNSFDLTCEAVYCWFLDNISVEIYEDYISTITSVHATDVMEVDWHATASSEPPQPPAKSNAKESAAQSKLNGFRSKVVETKKRTGTCELSGEKLECRDQRCAG